MTQQSFPTNEPPFSHDSATHNNQAKPQLDRSEMFALGAAAGAVVAAAISQYLESRQPKTGLEQAQDQGGQVLENLQNATKSGTKQVQGTLNRVSEQIEATLGAASDAKDTAKTRGRKQSSRLKGALGAALGGVAATALERAGEDPYAVSGSVRETLKEQADNTSSSTRGLGSSLKGLVASASDTTRSAAKDAQGYVKAAQLGEKAKQYSGVAAEKTKQYSGVAAEKTKDLVATAQKSLKDAQLDKRIKDVSGNLADYTSEAAKVTGKAAKQSAAKLSEGASQLAEATSEQAADLRKGVNKGVKRTRRRTKWGIRAFVVGLAVGLLTAPHSGQSTRETVTAFVEDLLDVFVSGEERSPISS
jgi:hypothetical protein